MSEPWMMSVASAVEQAQEPAVVFEAWNLTEEGRLAQALVLPAAGSLGPWMMSVSSCFLHVEQVHLETALAAEQVVAAAAVMQGPWMRNAANL
jgi:hypothetical protein